MLLVAFGYRELNTRVPDSGTSFTWSSKMFNPWIGWIGGWGLISATVIALSNLAAVAVDFFYILLAQIFQNPDIAAWTGNLLVYIPTTLLFTAIAAWLPTVGWPRPEAPIPAGDLPGPGRLRRGSTHAQHWFQPDNCERGLVRPGRNRGFLTVCRGCEPFDLHVLGLGCGADNEGRNQKPVVDPRS